MKINSPKSKSWLQAAFTLIEVVVGMAVIGVLFVALYSGLTYGFSRVKLSREDFRATQILLEKMETMRLYNWSQINSNNFIPEDFVATYYPIGSTNSQGVVYTGTLKIEKSDLSTNYKDEMKLVTVTLTWKTGNLSRTRTLSTYVAEHGLQNYIY